MSRDPLLKLAYEHELERRLDEAATEGFDGEIVRQCSELLSEPLSIWSARPALAGGDKRRVHEHLLVARLAYEAGIYDRALAALEAALADSPDDERVLRLQAALHHRCGRLTNAIAIWQVLAIRPPGGSPSSLRDLSQVLELSLHRATQRERPAPPELEAALHAALAPLEQSFRAALQGHLAAAIRTAETVATRFRASDLHVFKTASIHRAWLLEQAGNVHEAIATLERLADEPGLARDVERLLCLSRLYEREGTPERIRRAVRAVRYAYLMTREAPLLRRLSRLLDKLGHHQLAQRIEARYEDVFLRRHHALGLRETARAASLHYVPAHILRTVIAGGDEAREMMKRHLARRRPGHERRAAILAVAISDLERARSILASMHGQGRATYIDLLYLADVEAELGRAGAAAELRKIALAAHPDPDAVVWISLLHSAHAAPESTLLVLEPGERRANAARRITAYTRANPTRPEGWRALAAVEHSAGRQARAGDLLARAEALGAAEHGPPPGRTLAAAALRRGGEVRGLIHELWVDAVPAPERHSTQLGGWLEASDVLGAVSADLRTLAVNVFSAVRAFAAARFPERLRALPPRRFLLKFTKDDEPSSGDSAGLPMALAFLSALLSLPLPRDVASTGAVVCDAHDVIVVRKVGDVEAKIEGAFERRLGRLLVPEGNREDVDAAERVPRAVAASIVRYVGTLDEAVAVVFPDLV